MIRKGLLSSFYIQDKLIPKGDYRKDGILIGISAEWGGGGREGGERGLLQTKGSKSLEMKELGRGREGREGGAWMLPC